jgi:hypothetical protein
MSAIDEVAHASFMAFEAWVLALFATAVVFGKVCAVGYAYFVRTPVTLALAIAKVGFTRTHFCAGRE